MPVTRSTSVQVCPSSEACTASDPAGAGHQHLLAGERSKSADTKYTWYDSRGSAQPLDGERRGGQRRPAIDVVGLARRQSPVTKAPLPENAAPGCSV